MEYCAMMPYTAHRTRHIRLARHKGSPFGFSIRGGQEYGVGIFVSQVELGSQAYLQGLRVGDQILRVNGWCIKGALHKDVCFLLSEKSRLVLKVRSVGMIPVKDRKEDTLSWRLVDSPPTSPASVSPPGQGLLQKSSSISSLRSSSRSGDSAADPKIVLHNPGNKGLGCSICKGPTDRPGIFVQSTKEASVSREAGLRAGDQILDCNGRSFLNIEFTDAVAQLKSSPTLNLTIKRGVATDLFPGESSGYNSSSSSINGEGSPHGDPKSHRLSVVKEEEGASEERKLCISPVVKVDIHKEWDEIECEWDHAEKMYFESKLKAEIREKEEQRLKKVEEEKEKKQEERRKREEEEKRLLKEKERLEQEKREAIRIKLEEEERQKRAWQQIEEQKKKLLEEAEKLAEEKRRLEDAKRQESLAESPIAGSATSSLSSAISNELKRRAEAQTCCLGDKQSRNKDDDAVWRNNVVSHGRSKNLTVNSEKYHQHKQLMQEFQKVHRKMFGEHEETKELMEEKKCPQPVAFHKKLPAPQPPVTSSSKETSSIQNASTNPGVYVPPPPPVPQRIEKVIIEAKLNGKVGSSGKVNLPAPDYDMTPPASPKSKSIADSASLDSFSLSEIRPPPTPTPPPIYFDNPQKDHKPVLVPIVSYGAERPPPNKLEFLNPTKIANGSNVGTEIDYSSKLSKFEKAASQLQSELIMTLNRSNLKQKVGSVDNLVESPARVTKVQLNSNTSVIKHNVTTPAEKNNFTYYNSPPSNMEIISNQNNKVTISVKSDPIRINGTSVSSILKSSSPITKSVIQQKSISFGEM